MEIMELSIVVRETVDRVDSLIHDEHELVLASNLQDDLRWLRELLDNIGYVLSHGQNPDRLIKIKEFVYEAEDVINELTYEIFHPKVTQFNFLQKFLFKHKFSHKVKILNQLLSDTNPEETQYEDRFIPRTAVTHSVLDNPIIGREADVSKIVTLLTRSSHQQLLTVVPIAGMGRLGKTALAKLVCQRIMALNLFDIKLWVCVSNKCDELDIVGQMLRSLNAKMGGFSLLNNKDAVFQQLEIELGRKKFILVLDDVWGDVSSWWDDFRNRLLKMCTSTGNVVLVTTRSQQVASIVETSSHHRHTLDFLSDDDCWFILKERAFRNLRVQPDLEAIGREIAKKCRGVPLAAKILGGTLGFQTGIYYNFVLREWLEIRNGLVSDAGNNEKNVERILHFCYSHLPSSLKQCFAICSVFPKGFLIIKEDLIQMWIVERLVDSCDMGNTYFHMLLANSFFQDAESDADGNVIKCKKLNIELDFSLWQFHIRHPNSYLYVDYQSIRIAEALLKNKAKHLSTIILNGPRFQRSWNSKILRTLYLIDVDMKKLPSRVSKLRSFIYLNVSNTKARPLPKSIIQIYMLQALTLSNCSCDQLPLLGDLPLLKFLRISHMERVKCIGNESYGHSSNRHELQLFPALTSLSLSWMENLTEWSLPSHGKMIVIFPRLQSLSIQCCPKLTGFPMRDMSALVKIEIKDCEELRFIFDERMSFHYVTSLSIAGCPKLTYLQNRLLSDGYYKEFRVKRCEWLKFIPEDLGMQSFLVSLQIYCCKGLRVLSEEIFVYLTQLRKLSIGAFSEKLDDFCYLNRIKGLTSLEELEIWGSDVFGRKMSALPNQLQHLSNLQSLKIKGFTTMEALPEWLPNLRSLKTISLSYCWHLEYQSTTASIQQLPKLSHIYISGCRALEEHKFQWMEFLGTTNIIIVCQ